MATVTIEEIYFKIIKKNQLKCYTKEDVRVRTLKTAVE